MATSNVGQPESPLSLPEKLHGCILELIEAAGRLREAIVHRRTEEVWENLAEQQEKSALLEQYTRLFSQLADIPAADPVAQQGFRNRVRHDLTRLRALERSNASLCRGYLGAIRKALSKARNARRPRSNVYNHRGRVGVGGSAILIRRTG